MRGDVPSHRLAGLKREFQSELDIAGGSRTELRIAGHYIGCAAAAAKRGWCRGVVAAKPAIRRPVRVGDDGMVEQVKHLDAELGAVPLLERELLKYGEVHIPEARIAEDIPAHVAKGPRVGRS